MKFYVLVAAVLSAIPTASGAVSAADCRYSTTLADSRSGSIIFNSTGGFTVFANESASCVATLDVITPIGTFGVYKVDSRAFNNLAEGDLAEYTVLVEGDTQRAIFQGELSENAIITQYFGGAAGASFVGTFTYDLTKAFNGDSQSELDSIDVILAGYTTSASVQSSIDQLSTSRTSILTQINGTSELLIGGNQPIEAPDNFSLLGTLTPDTFGVTGHYNLGRGLSIDGGGALFARAVNEASTNGAIFAGAIRYLQPGSDTLRPFGKVAITSAPALTMNFSRHYEDGSPNGSTVVSATWGSSVGGSVEAGLLYVLNSANEIVISGTFARNWLSIDRYSETMSDTNLFPASVGESTGSFDILKATVAWTSDISPQVDLMLSGSLGKVFSHNGVSADVAFVGAIEGAAQDEIFAEYGARFGFQLSTIAKADAFVVGSTGANFDTHVQVGGALHVKF